MKLDSLPRGITGFRMWNEAELPRIDHKRFRTACHLAARLAGGSVESFDSRFLCQNYHSAVLRLDGERLRVLCNRHYPYLAFVAYRDNDMRLTFIDSPRLEEHFGALTEFQPIALEWLTRDVSREMLGSLGPAELEELRYWKPECVGEIVFNDWD